MDEGEELEEETGDIMSSSFDTDVDAAPSTPPPNPLESDCVRCTLMMENARKAFSEVDRLARQIAAIDDLHHEYDNLKKDHAATNVAMEELIMKQKQLETTNETVTAELNRMKEDRDRMGEQAEGYLKEAAKATAHVKAADEWRLKYVQSQATLAELAEQLAKLREKYAQSVDIAKDSVAIQSALQRDKKKLEDRANEREILLSAYKKNCRPIIKLLKDISADGDSTISSSLAQRIAQLPLEELLLDPTRRTDRIASDDEDVSRLESMLVDADSATVHLPPLTNSHTRNRNARGGRGARSRSFVPRPPPSDLSTPRAMEAREVEMAGCSRGTGQASSSVHGRKLESVREQQKKNRHNLSERIQRLKDTEKFSAIAAVFSVKGSDSEKKIPAAEATSSPSFTDMPDFDAPSFTGVTDSAPVSEGMVPSPEKLLSSPANSDKRRKRITSWRHDLELSESDGESQDLSSPSTSTHSSPLKPNASHRQPRQSDSLDEKNSEDGSSTMRSGRRRERRPTSINIPPTQLAEAETEKAEEGGGEATVPIPPVTTPPTVATTSTPLPSAVPVPASAPAPPPPSVPSHPKLSRFQVTSSAVNLSTPTEEVAVRADSAEKEKEAVEHSTEIQSSPQPPSHSTPTSLPQPQATPSNVDVEEGKDWPASAAGPLQRLESDLRKVTAPSKIIEIPSNGGVTSNAPANDMTSVSGHSETSPPHPLADLSEKLLTLPAAREGNDKMEDSSTGERDRESSVAVSMHVETLPGIASALHKVIHAEPIREGTPAGSESVSGRLSPHLSTSSHEHHPDATSRNRRRGGRGCGTLSTATEASVPTGRGQKRTTEGLLSDLAPCPRPPIAPKSMAITIPARAKGAAGKRSAPLPQPVKVDKQESFQMMERMRWVLRGKTKEQATELVPVASHLTPKMAAEALCTVMSEVNSGSLWIVVQKWHDRGLQDMDRNQIVPVIEKNLWGLMEDYVSADAERGETYSIFFELFSRRCHKQSSSDVSTVTKNSRSLAIALYASTMEKGRKEELLRDLVHGLLREKRSEAVLQSIVYLVVQSHTSQIMQWLWGETREGELGRLLSLHLSSTRDRAVVEWALKIGRRYSTGEELDSFSQEVEWARGVTANEVQEWWKETLAALDDEASIDDSIVVDRSTLEVSPSISRLIRMGGIVLSPRFFIQGLDRIEMLAEECRDLQDEMTTSFDVDGGDRTRGKRISARLLLCCRLLASFCTQSLSADGHVRAGRLSCSLLEKCRNVLQSRNERKRTVLITAIQECYEVCRHLSAYPS